MSPKKSPKGQVPPPDEWDFRMLSKDADLELVIEYEYFRSSALRSEIEKWHASDFLETEFSKSFSNAALLRDAGLIEWPKRGACAKIHNPNYNMWNFEKRSKDEQAARAEFEALIRVPCTVGTAISKIFSKVVDESVLDWAIGQLREDLPKPLAAAKAERIALRFDRFPKAWMKI